jgi:DNA-binding NarL/FixJ family response regulator
VDGLATAEEGWARTRLALAHPHELMLEALTWLLESAGFAVAARCATPDCLLRCLRAHVPDVAVVDADLAPGDALGALVGAAASARHGGRLVLLAAGVEPGLARETVTLELDGVLLKTAAAEDVVAGLRRVAAGDAVYPAGWLSAARRAGREAAGDPLSARQREVLELLAEGLPNEAIAEKLFISRNTVKFHVAGIYARLGVRNRVQAAQVLAATHPRG